jgi:hypothetical protein
MRTTIALDDDVLIHAQQIAMREKISLGKAVSQLARRALTAPMLPAARSAQSPYALIAADGKTTVTSQDVYRLLEQEGI